MKKLTIEEFQMDFDNLLQEVENGNPIHITSEHGDAVMLPIDDDLKELIKIYTELNNEAP